LATAAAAGASKLLSPLQAFLQIVERGPLAVRHILKQNGASLLPVTGECPEKELHASPSPAPLMAGSPGERTQFAHYRRLNALNIGKVYVEFARMNALSTVQGTGDLVQVYADHSHVFEQRSHDDAILAGQYRPNAGPLQQE
jgi:hypothetical protein